MKTKAYRQKNRGFVNTLAVIGSVILAGLGFITATGIDIVSPIVDKGQELITGDTVRTLDSFVSTSTPYNAITTRVSGKNLYFPNSTATTSRQYSNEYCINNSSPDCITSWPSGGSGGASFGQAFELIDVYTLAPTTTNAQIGVQADFFNATSTTATSSTNLFQVETAANFFGTYGNSWDDFCIAITGGSGLCDGTDNTGGGGGGYTNLTEFVDQTAWRLFYSNTNGDVTELALGTDGTYLKSNGATSAPTFASPVDDTAYNETTWNAVTSFAPSKNAIRDLVEDLIASIAGKLGSGDNISELTNNVGYIVTEADTLADVTGRGALTSTESEFSGGLISTQVKASGSGGLALKANNNTSIAQLGAGNTANVEWYGNHNFDTATANTIASFGASKTLQSLATSTYPSLSELAHVKGVTSAIQTQIDAKPTISSGAGAPASTPTKVGDIYIDTTGDDAYVAVGTASSADWEKSNDGTGGGGGVDTSGTPVANDFARFTDADTIEGRSYSEVKADLDLEIGTDVQAYDADLASIAGLSPSDDDFIQRKAGAWTNRTLAQVKTDLGLPKKLILSSGQGTTSTSLSDVTGLVFSASANKTYMFDFQVYYTSNVSTEGLGLGVNAPTGSTITYAVQIISSTAGAGRFEHATAADTKIQHTTGSTGGSYATVRGMVEVAGTAGNLALRFATETGGSNSNTIGAGSFGILTEVN